MSNDIKKKNKKRIIIYFLMIIFILMFIFSGKQIIDYIINSKENEKISDEISKYIKVDTLDGTKEGMNNEEKFNVDFNSLKTRNLDVVGFLKVNGTNIESIIVQGKDNSYYLSHNFEKKPNKGGWMFADYRNKFDGSDKNIIIYGHNMRDGSMFATLKNILNREWQEIEENKYVTFVTENENLTYEVFSVYQIEDEDYYITTDFNDDTSFEDFINKIKSRSRKDFNVEVTSKDQILTLSTCANDNKYRVVLHARKIANN